MALGVRCCESVRVSEGLWVCVGLRLPERLWLIVAVPVPLCVCSCEAVAVVLWLGVCDEDWLPEGDALAVSDAEIEAVRV